MNRNMMRQAQRLQAQIQKVQEELETLTVEGTGGGGGQRRFRQDPGTDRPENVRHHRRLEYSRPPMTDNRRGLTNPAGWHHKPRRMA